MSNVQLDDDDIDDFVGDDEWEDGPTVEQIKAKYPDSWMICKVTNFTEGTMADMRQWCTDNCQSKYEHVGWGGSCSYTVGVIFEGYSDAVMFKLIWGS